MFLEEYNIIIRNKKPTKSGNYVFYYTFNSPNKWRKIESICSPHEHPNDSDVHIVTNECSYQHNSDVHEVNTNNKKLTIRNNNDLENDFCSSFNEELEIFDDKSEDIRNKNEPLVTKKKMPEFYKQLPNNHPAVKKWEEENSF